MTTKNTEIDPRNIASGYENTIKLANMGREKLKQNFIKLARISPPINQEQALEGSKLSLLIADDLNFLEKILN